MDVPDNVMFVRSKHDGTLLETLVHEPQVIKDRNSSQSVRVAVIAHPWSVLGGNMYDHVVQETFGLFSGHGFLVATFNCRGAGRSGGRSGASAQTETEDYESVVASLISTAEKASVPISKLYICGYSYGSFIASLVAPPIPETNYILISPLLSPIASLTTFFTASTSKGILSKQSAQMYSASMQHILAVYGTGDIFAFTTGRYRRYFEQVKEDWGDQVRVVEIDEGGHFWLGARARKCLLEKIEAFTD